MKFSDLILTPQGKVSHTKLWGNIACATATFAIIWQTVKNGITYDILGMYLAIVGGYSTASKFLRLKYPGEVEDKEKKP